MKQREILYRINHLKNQVDQLNQQFPIRSTIGIRKYYEKRIAKQQELLTDRPAFNFPLA